MPPLQLEGEGIQSSLVEEEVDRNAGFSLCSLVPKGKGGPRTGLMKETIPRYCCCIANLES